MNRKAAVEMNDLEETVPNGTMIKQRDPFAVRMIFLRVGWMHRYQGIRGGDTITRGGAYVTKHLFGHEIFNYLPFKQVLYGYAQPPSRSMHWTKGQIQLHRLCGTKKDKSVSGVTAVWVATAPSGGAFVVGWYKNATVYRTWQPPPLKSDRRHDSEEIGYYVAASAVDCVLLPPDQRVFPIPQKGKGKFGQSNIWYADDPAQHHQLRRELLRYIDSRQLPQQPEPSGFTLRQADPLVRQRVEQIAIETTADYFTRLGYRVESVEHDNVGWDLNAQCGKRDLKLEVKGLSCSQIVVELTPKEWVAMKTYLESYRVCVVTDALSAPSLEIFTYSPDSRQWESLRKRVLSIQEIIAVRCSST